MADQPRAQEAPAVLVTGATGYIGDAWCPSSNGRAFDCAVWPGNRPPSPLASRQRRRLKVPGRAWLEFEVVPDGSGALVHQTAVFEPTGLSGRLYWYMLLPVHAMIFGGMLRQIAQRARGGRT